MYIILLLLLFIFLDFAKAFDKVHHGSLIEKLSKYGVTGQLLNWIRAFLSNRRQRVVLGDTQSEWTSVTSGVPQGSVLGPTLFAIFINDLPDYISSSCKMFADDTKILAPIHPNCTDQDSAALQADIDKVVDWCYT